MIDRSLYTPDGTNPPFPVPINDLCTVPTAEMAYLLASLVLGEDEAKKDIMEIGTGSGYQTAILAERCRSVVSIDVELHTGVADRLPNNVAIAIANGYEFDTSEQFDGVLVTFGTKNLSLNWIRQVKDGGRLVVPIVAGPNCRITVFEKHGSALVLIDVVAYAPFTPGAEA